MYYDYLPRLPYTPYPSWPWPPWPSQGWQCPVCKNVYAPAVAQCMQCQKPKQAEATEQ